MKIMLMFVLAACAAAANAQDDPRDARIALLEERLERLEEANRERLDKEEEAAEAERFNEDLWFKRTGPVTFRLIDISVNALFAVGYSSVKDEYTRGLQGGAHDPIRRGFTLQQIELSFVGAVDPLFKAAVHIVASEHGIELEEGYFETTDLPVGLQVRGGYFLTEFGRMNPTHAHSWDFMDQPVVNTRLMGPEGTRGIGARIGWTAPTPWHFELKFSMQNANDASMISFLGEGHEHGGHDEDDHGDETVGGWGAVEREIESFHEFLYLMRIAQFWEVGETFGLGLGLSGMYGANRSGDTGKTWIGGMDLTTHWEGGDDFFVKTQVEVMYRYFQADRFTHGEDPDVEVFNATVLGDWGAYGFVHFGWTGGWQFGLRAEFADAFREGELLRQEDPLRDRRYRVSGLIEWEASEWSRLRLQYNFDHMEHLRHSTAHSIWLGIEVILG
jgi:hypothetical protein